MRHSSEMLGVVRDQNRALPYCGLCDQAIGILEQIAFGVELLPDSRGGVERAEFQVKHDQLCNPTLEPFVFDRVLWALESAPDLEIGDCTNAELMTFYKRSVDLAQQHSVVVDNR